jgi:hypothetical protein
VRNGARCATFPLAGGVGVSVVVISGISVDEVDDDGGRRRRRRGGRRRVKVVGVDAIAALARDACGDDACCA